MTPAALAEILCEAHERMHQKHMRESYDEESYTPWSHQAPADIECWMAAATAALTALEPEVKRPALVVLVNTFDFPTTLKDLLGRWNAVSEYADPLEEIYILPKQGIEVRRVAQ